MRGKVVHLYLSPHLDDATLSCGGLIHRQRTEGESVIVATLCAASPDYDRLSPFARQYHAAWGNLPDLVASRRIEDGLVLRRWGVKVRHCDTQDSIYRRVEDEVAYPDLAALFAKPHPQELETLPALWQAELADLLFCRENTVIYAPLAAGNHVDHQLVRALGVRLLRQGWRVWFYEDYPHVQKARALQEAQA
jgi:LmbE family N-acetylglucosaminyl deacetylase